MRRYRPRFGLASLCGVMLFSIACDRAVPLPRTADGTVHLTVREHAVAAPDTVRTGWRRVRVDEADGEHIIVLFRLPDSTTSVDVARFIAELDTASTTPPSALAVGGTEVGKSGEVFLHLTPGAYVAACVRRGDDMHRHARRGEVARIIVPVGTPADSVYRLPPSSADTVRMADFAYVGTEQWTRGTHWLRIENSGQQDHQLRLARLHDGESLKSWMSAEDPADVATTFVGMARIGPGEVAYLPVDLAPGAYVLYCLVADAVTRKPHLELGMFRLIRVP